MNNVEAMLRLRQVISRQHKALVTEENHVFWLRCYMSVIDRMPATLFSEKKLERFLTNRACHLRLLHYHSTIGLAKFPSELQSAARW